MRRRTTILGGVAILLPLLAHSQRMARVGWLSLATTGVYAEEMKLMDQAASTLGITLVRVMLKTDAPDVVAAVRYAVSMNAQAMLTAPMTSNYFNLDPLAAEAKRLRLPLVHDIPQLTSDGLAVYGPDFEDIFRRAGHYTARILKGEKPAEMEIEEPRSFQLVVNLKTARAMGITIPQSVRLRADQVIE